MSPAKAVETDRIHHENRIGAAYGKHSVLLWAILASVLLHTVLLGLLIGFSAQYQATPTPLTQAIELIVFEPASPPQPEPELILPEPVPEVPTEPVNETTESTAAFPDAEAVTRQIEQPDRTSDETAEQPPTTIVRLDPEQLRQQLRATLEASIEIPESPEHAPGLLSSEAVDVPGMPAPAGWMNDYVGTVESSVDQWRNPGGSLQSRQVLASGHIVCTQGAHQSLFGPFSIGWPPIAMSRICGRERPTPVDTTRIEHRPMIKPQNR